MTFGIADLKMLEIATMIIDIMIWFLSFSKKNEKCR